MHSAHMCTESASDRGNRKQDAVCADEDEVAAGVDAQRAHVARVAALGGQLPRAALPLTPPVQLHPVVDARQQLALANPEPYEFCMVWQLGSAAAGKGHSESRCAHFIQSLRLRLREPGAERGAKRLGDS